MSWKYAWLVGNPLLNGRSYSISHGKFELCPCQGCWYQRVGFSSSVSERDDLVAWQQQFYPESYRP